VKLRKKQNHFALTGWPASSRRVQKAVIPLEDELGDVLEKAVRQAGLSLEEVGRRADVSLARLLDAIDYRSDLNCRELGRLAAVLDLNEVGLCALAEGKYPLPVVQALPFCLHALRMPHGIGVSNAYVVSECGATEGVLFDVGPSLEALLQVWPAGIATVSAIFVTHGEAEHTGGLCAVAERFAVGAVYCPDGVVTKCGRIVGEPAVVRIAGLEVSVLSTPGHAVAHNSYLVKSQVVAHGDGMLVAGDLIFAGSAGGGYHCPRQSQTQLARVMRLLAPGTLIAPGHGPLTTVANERRYNPFIR
jgi:hydroxyacylglutathione hydrolase